MCCSPSVMVKSGEITMNEKNKGVRGRPRKPFVVKETPILPKRHQGRPTKAESLSHEKMKEYVKDVLNGSAYNSLIRTFTKVVECFNKIRHVGPCEKKMMLIDLNEKSKSENNKKVKRDLFIHGIATGEIKYRGIGFDEISGEPVITEEILTPKTTKFTPR